MNTDAQRPFRLQHRMRVRWAEVDMQRIVFNAHYLMYLDTAMAQYWRAMGFPYETSMPKLGGDLFVKKVALTYHASAKYDDDLSVRLRCNRVGQSSLVFDGEVAHGAQLLVSGELIYVFADPVAQKSKGVPDVLRKWLHGFEAGEPMTTTTTEAWADCEREAMALRKAVFAGEKHIAADLLQDQFDAKALQAVVRNRLGDVVAAGRAYTCDDEPGTWHIGRMCVERGLRGDGLGRSVLTALEAQIQYKVAKRVVLNAMVSAQAFYAKAGYRVIAEPTVLAGIAHVLMEKA